METTLIRKAMMLAMFMLACMTGRATDYYVSLTGNDVTGNGSATSPWRTVQHAVSQITGQGHTINVLSGTYVFSSQLNLPVGINLVGAGKDSTIFKFSSALYYPIVDSNYHFDKMMIRLDTGVNASPQILRDFQVNGDGKQVWGGIYINRRNNIEVYNITIKDTYFTGIWFWKVTGSSLHDSYFENCAWGTNNPSPGWQSGAVQLSNLQSVNFYNLTISEGITNTTLYGYGMKAITPDITVTPLNVLNNIKVYNSVFTCNPLGIWNSGQAPNIAVEFHQAKVVNCEIYGNTFNNNLSLVNNASPNITGENSVRVHDNKFIKPTGTGSESFYALELTENNAEIDHNHFDGGYFPIALWSGNGAAATGWKIHHNSFINHHYYLIRAETGLTNVTFYNNTCYINQTDIPYCFIASGLGASVVNFDIKNNIFTSVAGTTPIIFATENGGTLTNVTASYNCLNHVSPGSETDSNNITADPKLVASGTQPEPFFDLQSGSPCINTGANVGFTVPDGQPDIGAFEYRSSGSTSQTIDFSTQASGYGDLDNSKYTNVAGGVQVTFYNVQRYDGTMWMGDADHSSSSDNKMGFFPTNTAYIDFNTPVEVPSLWISTMVYGQYGAVITGTRYGTPLWSKEIPGEDYGIWVEVTEGTGLQIDQITFSGISDYGIDDITIVNTSMRGPGERVGYDASANKTTTLEMKESGDEYKVFPNPVRAGENLKLILPNACKINLLDVSGKIIRQGESETRLVEMQTDGLAGLYLLRLESKTGIQLVKVVVY